MKKANERIKWPVYQNLRLFLSINLTAQHVKGMTYFAYSRSETWQIICENKVGLELHMESWFLPRRQRVMLMPSLSFALRAAQLYCHYGCCELGENLSKPIIAAFQRLLRIENYHVCSVRKNGWSPIQLTNHKQI